jgi:hypothetical protein
MFSFLGGALCGSIATGFFIVVFIDFILRAVDHYSDWSEE